MPDSEFKPSLGNLRNTGLCKSAWTIELECDCDQDFLLYGILNGFNIINVGAKLEDVLIKNHKSATDPAVREAMDNIILNEIAEGNYVPTSVKPIIVSALGAVPKSDGGIRPIHDCSLPVDTGLNSHAPQFMHYSYESVDDAVRCIKQGHFMAKIDLHHAYRSVDINPQSYMATGLHWTFLDGTSTFLYDTKLSFGAKASPTIFHRLSQAVKRMMARRGFTNVVAYQDDFFISAANYSDCLKAFNVLYELLEYLGFRINNNKIVYPTTSLIFLGIRLDSVTCELSLPEEKLDAIKATVTQFQHKKRATKLQLQSLVGKLSFAARVVRGGRTFLRRIFNAIASLKKQHHKVRLQGAIKGDLQWWHHFLSVFNGVTAFIEETNVCSVSTDACLQAGGAFYNGDIHYTVWQADNPDVADLCINYLEAMAIIKAVQRWCFLFKNKLVYIYTDNQCAATLLNKCSCKSEIIMKYMREMFWTSVMYNFVIKVCYMPGCLQTIPDAISRMHETNGLSNVELLINNWYKCHMHNENIFYYYNMLNHMSIRTLVYILDQVMTWRNLKFLWTKRCGNTDKQPLHLALSQHMHAS